MLQFVYSLPLEASVRLLKRLQSLRTTPKKVLGSRFFHVFFLGHHASTNELKRSFVAFTGSIMQGHPIATLYTEKESNFGLCFSSD